MLRSVLMLCRCWEDILWSLWCGRVILEILVGICLILVCRKWIVNWFRFLIYGSFFEIDIKFRVDEIWRSKWVVVVLGCWFDVVFFVLGCYCESFFILFGLSFWVFGFEKWSVWLEVEGWWLWVWFEVFEWWRGVDVWCRY